ncbi:MAG: cobalamin-dependent protein, partial [Clostridia bacterium]|nr:cobalamin-dependent protein [Clostridia bacterium]
NTKPEALERALRVYAGVPIINSVNGKKESMEGIFPIAKKYGAMVIALALDENGIPETAEARFDIAKRIIDAGVAYGIPKEKFIVDCLTLSAASDMKAASDTFEALRRVKSELGVLTTLGASNASFGLPCRDILNSVYLTMAFAHGLDAPITDPTCEELQKSIYGVRFFKNEEVSGDTFLNKYGNVVNRTVQEKSFLSLREIVIDGLKDEALNKTKDLLKERTPDDVIDNELIPALDYVGNKFEKGELFLPQLLRCAETVKESFEAVKAAYADQKVAVKTKGKVVLATVEGDVHDIGKNIVKILLENYGFEVIDLGKDVPAATVVSAVREHQVELVGLSALMTTTVPFMEKTIQALSEASDINAKVLVGGAVLTQEYADEIGADFYAKDARETVRIAQRILNVSKI